MKIHVYDRDTDKCVSIINDPYTFYEASTHYIVATAVDDIVCVETVIPKVNYYCFIED